MFGSYFCGLPFPGESGGPSFSTFLVIDSALLAMISDNVLLTPSLKTAISNSPAANVLIDAPRGDIFNPTPDAAMQVLTAPQAAAVPDAEPFELAADGNLPPQASIRL